MWGNQMIISEKQLIFLLHYIDLYNNQALTPDEIESLKLRSNQLVNEIRTQQPEELKEIK